MYYIKRSSSTKKVKRKDQEIHKTGRISTGKKPQQKTTKTVGLILPLQKKKNVKNKGRKGRGQSNNTAQLIATSV